MWVVKASVYITPILTLLYNSTNKLYNNKLLTLLLQISFRDNAPIYWNKRSHIVKPDRISPRRGKIGEIESAQTTVIIETEANLIDWTPDGRQWSEKEKSKKRKCVKVVRHWPSRLDEINDDLCVSISSFFFVIRWRGNEWLCWNRCVMLLLYSQQQECRVLAVGNKLLEQVLSHLDSARYPDNSQSIQYWFRIQHVEM
jgi:hypothetical protein